MAHGVFPAFWSLRGTLLSGLWLPFMFVGLAHAQPPASEADPAPVPQTVEIAGKRVQVADDDLDPASATPDPAPPVPTVLEHAPRAEKIAVVEQAGVGGPLAYASATVLEVGGSGSISAGGSHLYLRMAPFVAWFVLDGLQLSYTHEIYLAKFHADYRISTALLVGGSVHFRLTDRLLIAVGPDTGALYNGDRWGVMLRPKTGLDILVGRSAILHPGLFMSWSSVDLIDSAGTNMPDQRLSFGFDIGYSAMF